MEHRESCRSLRVSIVDGERGEPAEMFNQSGAGDTGSDNADHSSRGVTGRQPPSIERGATRPFMRTTSAAIAAMINTIATRRRNAMILRNVATVLLQPSVVRRAGRAPARNGTEGGTEATVSDVRAAIDLQASACRRLGSVQYADLLGSIAGNVAAGGAFAELLHGRTDRPVHDALPLRLLGSLHGLALSGGAPRLAARFPSCGGDGSTIPLADVLDAVARHRSAIEDGLARHVQTNEPGRSVALLLVANWLPSIGIREFDLLEVGSSAGLNLSFDDYAADTGSGVLGLRDSALVFPPSWFDRAPRAARDPARCIDRRGCDVAPLDPVADAVRLQSFVWPDQSERLSRLRTAIAIASTRERRVKRASADRWTGARLAERTRASRPVVVFHSIVWQYLGATVQERLRAAIVRAGESTANGSVVWARMEPAGDRADLRADAWVDGAHSAHVLADIGYHGADVTWHGP